ncbi:MAG: filamentous hemagglutinin N-terminal domain-containing protein [Methylococcales bacterium]|nr:filamentous hemagglutinin N-terminal domain-containing protein [Methylococcales bacterium]
MNHIYRSIWNEALSAWVAVSEITKGQGKRSSNRRKNITASPLKDWQSLPLLATSLLLFSSASWALPTGNELIAGQATVNTPSAGQMQIDQASQQAVINWQGFSIAPTEAVNIQQPNAQAALLNRVVGGDASQIQGQLHANGQVYLVNPNGVMFGKTAQVDVGGLIASTHEISNADFMAGKNHFTQNGATGSVENHGTINVPNGGVVALISSSVTNTGTINTPKGTTALAAGKTVDLDFQGDGLVEVKVSEAALNAQITNKGAIQADGGRVVLTAKAAGQLIDTVINQAGIIKAQGLVERNGEIILDGGDNGKVQVSGTLDTDNTNQGLNSNANNGSPNLGLNASTTGGKISVTGNNIQINNGAIVTASGDNGGGVITIGDKVNTRQTSVQQGATVNAQALNNGKAGTIKVFANMDSGTVNVAGKLDASAPKSGDGGFIDTSAAKVKIADSANISTRANTGKTGAWLIDPFDFTISATGGNMTGAALSTALNSNAVTILAGNLATSCTGATCTAGSAGVGDINVNDVINWSSNSLLTLNAWRNININANITGSGASSKLLLLYGQGGGATDNYFINNGASVNLLAGQNFSTQLGAAAIQNYTVITSLGAETDATGGAATLQGMAATANLAGLYVLGGDINAAATSGWNLVGLVNQGFTPIGSTGSFTGKFDGLGHTITGLTINRLAQNIVGLFGVILGGSVSNVGLLGGSVIGQNNVGGLVGQNIGGSINNAYVKVSVSGTNNVGGLVGLNTGGTLMIGGSGNGNITNVYATGSVSGTSSVGGLVGSNSSSGIITNAYATGSVTGASNVGGLVGNNGFIIGSSIITNAYATGSVTGASNVGGLVGNNSVTGTITTSFWNKDIAGNTGVGTGTTTGATGKTTAQMQQMATFSGAGWNIANTGGSTAIWRIYEGNTTPLLRSFLTPLTVAANAITKTYNGLSDSTPTYTYTNTTTGATITPNANLLGTATVYGTAKNVGTYTASTTGLFSNQQGYDISNGTVGSLTITPATLTYTANAASRLYGAANPVFSGTLTGFVNGETQATATTGLLGFSSLANNLSNVGSYTIDGSGLIANFGNYIFRQAAGNATALSIIEAVKSSVGIVSAVPRINDSSSAFQLGENAELYSSTISSLIRSATLPAIDNVDVVVETTLDSLVDVSNALAPSIAQPASNLVNPISDTIARLRAEYSKAITVARTASILENRFDNVAHNAWTEAYYALIEAKKALDEAKKAETKDAAAVAYAVALEAVTKAKDAAEVPLKALKEAGKALGVVEKALNAAVAVAVAEHFEANSAAAEAYNAWNEANKAVAEANKAETKDAVAVAVAEQAVAVAKEALNEANKAVTKAEKVLTEAKVEIAMAKAESTVSYSETKKELVVDFKKEAVARTKEAANVAKEVAAVAKKAADVAKKTGTKEAADVAKKAADVAKKAATKAEKAVTKAEKAVTKPEKAVAEQAAADKIAMDEFKIAAEAVLKAKEFLAKAKETNEQIDHAYNLVKEAEHEAMIKEEATTSEGRAKQKKEEKLHQYCQGNFCGTRDHKILHYSPVASNVDYSDSGSWPK